MDTNQIRKQRLEELDREIADLEFLVEHTTEPMIRSLHHNLLQEAVANREPARVDAYVHMVIENEKVVRENARLKEERSRKGAEELRNPEGPKQHKAASLAAILGHKYI